VTFRARLRHQSAVWNLWMNHHRLGGVVCGVQFNRSLPGEYTTVELSTDQVSALRDHEGVLIEAMTQPIPVEPVPIEVPAGEPVMPVMQARMPPMVEKAAAAMPVMQARMPPIVEKASPAMPIMSAKVPQRRSPMPPPVPEVVSPPQAEPMTADERRADRQRRLTAANKRDKFNKYG
jgi:hypothetical protein